MWNGKIVKEPVEIKRGAKEYFKNVFNKRYSKSIFSCKIKS